MLRNVFSPTWIRFGILFLGLAGLAQLIYLPSQTSAHSAQPGQHDHAGQAQEYRSCKCKQKGMTDAAASRVEQGAQQITPDTSGGIFKNYLEQQSPVEQSSKTYAHEQDQVSPNAVAVALTPGVPVTGTISPASPGSCVLSATQYTIVVPLSATQLTINLTGNLDVDLFARFDQPIVIQGGQLIADHGSTSLSGTEVISITSISSPPLRQGTYHIAIGNCSPGVASFTLAATLTTSDGQSIALTSGIPTNGMITAPNPGNCVLGATQYTIEVPFNSAQLKIDLVGNQDVDLFVRRGQRVAVQGGQPVADYLAVSSSTSESITITLASSPPLQSGVYFIGIGNCSSVAASFTITATVSTQPPPDRPNLTPFQPSGWSDRIIVSKVTETNTDSSSLSANDTLHIDWAARNSGTAATATRFTVRLFVDGVERMNWFTDPPLNVGAHTFIEDHSIGSLSAGNHTIKIVVDAQNNIVESSELDNEYTRNILVSAQTCHTLTANASPAEGGAVSRSSESGCPAPAGALQQLSSTVPSLEWPGHASISASFNETLDSLNSRAESTGSVRVIVGLQARFRPEGALDSPQTMAAQRDLIAQAQNRLLSRMPRVKRESLKLFRTIPFLAMEVDAVGLRYLQSSTEVSSVEEDMLFPPLLAESVALIGGPAAWAMGYSGAGQAIAIIDTGVDKNHTFFGGRVVSEACFSTTSPGATTSVCPAGASQSTAPGSGLHCIAGGCEHGTHVAGIAAGKGATFSGVAPDANIIAIQVFSRSDLAAVCGSEPTPCVRSFQSDVVRGLEQVLQLASTFNIAAVNMSLGGGKFTSICDAQQASTKAVIDNLRSLGIATVIASGNNGFSDSLSAPACISSAISVGSTADGSGGSVQDAVSGFSNSAGFLNLLAPGQFINSSLPLNHFDIFQGTSMAAPHVAGAFAVLKSKVPSASVSQVLAALTNTGVPVLDPRNGLTRPRIQIDAALNALSGGGGIIPDQFIEGGMVTLTATSNTGYTFIKWQRDGQDFSTSPTINVTINDSHTMIAVFSRGPVIDSAIAQTKKLLKIDGSNFGQAPRVLINGVDRSNFIKSASTTSITLKGKLKKLGIKAGENTIQIIGDGGVESNLFTLTQ